MKYTVRLAEEISGEIVYRDVWAEVYSGKSSLVYKSTEMSIESGQYVLSVQLLTEEHNVSFPPHHIHKSEYTYTTYLSVYFVMDSGTV